jgi:Inner membrane protein YgaP-like, transmembrane domain
LRYALLARIVAGLALLSMPMFVTSNSKWLGLIGLVPLLTAFVGWCPAYGALGVNTCPTENLR